MVSLRREVTMVTIGVLLACIGSAVGVEPRELSFEQRVGAQAAIERVYHSHQIGGRLPFERAVPSEVVERKVRTYLAESVALERLWGTPVTAEALRREMERIDRRTRLPDRLAEIRRALDDDPFLLLECLARPALVDRMARSFFAHDSRIHVQARAAAEMLRAQLREGASARAEGAVVLADGRFTRSIVDLRRVEADGADADRPRPSRNIVGSEPEIVALDPAAFAARRAEISSRVGEAGEIRERSDEFAIDVLLSESDGRLVVETYHVAKRTWDDWWNEARKSLDGPVAAVPDRAWTVAPPANGARVVTGARPATDPACILNDTWDAGALDGAPDPRIDSTAVWTGSEMIVWGGRDSGGFLGTGNRYDPLLDTWTRISSTNAPSARSTHTAVWTGTTMIVWGGQASFMGNDYTASGGRYDPATDSWLPTSTAGAPAARNLHSAVWTGSRMIVWSGFDVNGLTKTGGQYDPATNSWTATNSSAAPAARTGHTAVWTGSRMIVWGGFTQAGPSNIGARYNPANNTWEDVSTFSSPAARSSHTAVWSGSRMIIWEERDRRA